MRKTIITLPVCRVSPRWQLHRRLFPALGKKTKPFSDFVQFCLKILHWGGFSHSSWETLLKARPSEFHTTCSLWFIQIAPSCFKSCHRSSWDGHLLHLFTILVVNPVDPPNYNLKIQCLDGYTQVLSPVYGSEKANFSPLPHGARFF